MNNEFDYQKKLADIGIEIAKARSVLSQLINDKDKFIEKREKECQEKIDDFLGKSREALDMIRNNENELVDYHSKLIAFTSELLSFKQKIDIKEKEIEIKFNEQKKDIDRKYNEISDIIENLKQKKSLIQIELNLIDAKNENINRLKKHIESQQETLMQAYKLIKEKS